MTKPDICIPVPIGRRLRETMRLLARQLGGYLLLMNSATRTIADIADLGVASTARPAL
jgi:hypothetical protein